MAASPDKVIVTNVSALKRKYGSNYSAVEGAIKNLIAADKARGLTTIVVDLSDAQGLARLKGKPVTTPGNTKQNKAAVDAVYKALVPSYLLILGSVDVVPHQDLKNPAYDPGGDDDRFAPGDLPYACDHAYSQRAADFLAPTRVVGRLPDVTGQSDPAYLVGLLKTASTFKSRPASDYLSYLGVSASVWSSSTSSSLQEAFGSGGALRLAPPDGPNWTSTEFQQLSHFFNCHGSAADPQWYGQKGTAYPAAHQASVVAQRAAEGTVVAAECCYGAELYNPTVADGQMGICNTYLQRNAYGVFGSSTIAYGPASGNANADLICQYFFKRLLAGASIGRAALQARQDFIRSATVLDPYDLKTLAQFSLMADPALTPVKSMPVDHGLGATLESRGAEPVVSRSVRALGRERLRRYGLAVGAAAAATERDEKATIPAKIRKAMAQVVAASGAPAPAFQSHTVVAPGGRAAAKATTKALTEAFAPVLPQRVYVAVSLLGGDAEARTNARVRPLVVVVARESAEGVVYRTLYSR